MWEKGVREDFPNRQKNETNKIQNETCAENVHGLSSFVVNIVKTSHHAVIVGKYENSHNIPYLTGQY